MRAKSSRPPSSAGSPQDLPDVSSEPSPAEGEPSLDVVFELLSNERRRRVLRYLLSNSSETTLGTLAEHIAAIENDKPEDALSSSERKRVYICLYQCHLPKMDDADVIDFDGDRKTVELADNAEYMVHFLPELAVETESESWRDTLTRLVDRLRRTLSRPN